MKVPEGLLLAFLATAVAAATPAADVAAPFEPSALHRTAVWGDAVFRHADTVTAIVPLPDGRRLLTASQDGSARLWDASTGKELRRFHRKGNGNVWNVALLPGGVSFLDAGEDGSVTEWNLETGATNRLFRHGVRVYRLAVAPDGKSFYAGDSSGAVVQWSLVNGEEIRRLSAHKKDVYTVALGGAGRRIVTGSSDKSVIVWDAASGAAVRTLPMGDDVSTVVVSPDGLRFLSVSSDKGVACQAFEPDASGWTAQPASGSHAAAWMPDGAAVFVPSETGLHLLDALSGEIKLTRHGAKRSRWACAVSPDGRTLYAGIAHVIRRIDPATLEDRGPGADPAGDVGGRRGLAFLPAVSNAVWIADEDAGELARWSATAGAATNWIVAIAKPRELVASADGRRIAVAGSEGDVLILATDDGRTLAHLAGGDFRSRYESMVFDAAGAKLFVGRQNGTITIHDAAGGGQVGQLAVKTPRVADPDDPFGNYDHSPAKAVAISEDGRFAACVAGSDQVLAVWDVASERRIEATNLGERFVTWYLAFCGADNRTVLGAAKKRIVAWPSPESQAGRVDADQVKRLVAQLGADGFQQREDALKKLIEIGEPAVVIASKLPIDDPEIAERLKIVREKAVRQKEVEPEALALDLGAECHDLRAIPGTPFWVALVGDSSDMEIVVGEYRNGALKVLRRIADEHSPSSLAAGPHPRSLVTGNGDGTFSLYEW